MKILLKRSFKIFTHIGGWGLGTCGCWAAALADICWFWRSYWGSWTFIAILLPSKNNWDCVETSLSGIFWRRRISRGGHKYVKILSMKYRKSFRGLLGQVTVYTILYVEAVTENISSWSGHFSHEPATDFFELKIQILLT